MGTRHLIEVRCNGETKIAQYGQWDGYLSGQGVTILAFLRKYADREKWVKRLKRCYFYQSDEEIYARFPNLKHNEDEIPAELSRDTGAKILMLVYKSKEKVGLVNSKGFELEAGCEYYYVIDMDEETFTVRSRRFTKSYSLNNLPEEKDFLTLDT